MIQNAGGKPVNGVGMRFYTQRNALNGLVPFTGNIKVTNTPVSMVENYSLRATIVDNIPTDELLKLLAKIDGLEARIELTELLNNKANFRLDERA